MKKFVKIMVVILALVCALSFAACDGKTPGINGDPAPDLNGDTSPNPNPNGGEGATEIGDVMSISKKYYDRHFGALTGDAKDELGGAAGAVNFTGALKDDEKAEELCTIASFLAMFNGNGNTAVACAAAAVGWSSGYARSYGTLAAMLRQATCVTDGNKLKEAKKLAEHAISLDKNDIELYITLSQILQDLKDIDGAVKAIDSALAIDPGNNAASIIKLNLLTAGGGGANAGNTAREIGNDLVENDGELSKSLTELENDTESMEGAKDGDSKEVSLQKLNALYTLKPVTPADMVKDLFPQQANQLRDKITTVSEQDKKLGLPEFPMKLVGNLDLLHSSQGYVEYSGWWTSRLLEFQQMEMSIAMSTTSRAQGQTSADYMRDYNKQVVRAAIADYVNYCNKLWHDADDEIDNQERIYAPKKKAAEDLLESEAKSLGYELAALNYKGRINTAIKAGAQIIVGAMDYRYTNVRREGQKLWENMLPFARCTRNPGNEVSTLYHYIYNFSAPSWDAATFVVAFGGGEYYPNLEEAIAEYEAAMAQAKQAEELSKADVLEGLTLSASLGPFEFKLSSNGVEVECVAGLAIRAAYNPSKGTADFGVGAGYKAGIGVPAAQLGVEGKVYMNFTFDLRNKEVTDIYYTAEAKGKFVGLEAGGQVRASAFGKGVSVTAAAKQQFGVGAVEREVTLFSTE